MIHWQGTTTEAVNTTTTSDVVTITATVMTLVAWSPDDEREYETFREGCEFRLDRWHVHPWIIETVKRLAPTPKRPRRIEESGFGTRWTSGFK